MVTQYLEVNETELYQIHPTGSTQYVEHAH